MGNRLFCLHYGGRLCLEFIPFSIIIIFIAGKKLGVPSSDLYSEISVYVNVEPCIMCAAALMKVRKGFILADGQLYRA